MENSQVEENIRERNGAQVHCKKLILMLVDKKYKFFSCCHVRRESIFSEESLRLLWKMYHLTTINKWREKDVFSLFCDPFPVG